jgi:CheY-like chemotaxis protein
MSNGESLACRRVARALQALPPGGARDAQQEAVRRQLRTDIKALPAAELRWLWRTVQQAQRSGTPTPQIARTPALWYQIEHSHLRGILAADEDAARVAILAAEPQARSQHLTLTPMPQAQGAPWQGDCAGLPQGDMGEPTTILVIDDDPDIRALLQDMLEVEGCAVVTAPDAQRGLEQAQAYRPALILLDYQMPYQDGPWFATAYRQLEGPHAPIVLITAATNAPQRAAEVRAEACLGKPFDMDTLVSLVEKYAA